MHECAIAVQNPQYSSSLISQSSLGPSPRSLSRSSTLYVVRSPTVTIPMVFAAVALAFQEHSDCFWPLGSAGQVGRVPQCTHECTPECTPEITHEGTPESTHECIHECTPECTPTCQAGLGNYFTRRHDTRFEKYYFSIGVWKVAFEKYYFSVGV